MYSIQYMLGEDGPFDLVTDIKGLPAALTLLSKREFKVSFAGVKIMPKALGWGDQPGWIERFQHEIDQSNPGQEGGENIVPITASI